MGILLRGYWAAYEELKGLLGYMSGILTWLICGFFWELCSVRDSDVTKHGIAVAVRCALGRMLVPSTI